MTYRHRQCSEIVTTPVGNMDDREEVARGSSGAEAIITSLMRVFPVVGIALWATIIGFVTLYIC
jgi:hypothetical protein